MSGGRISSLKPGIRKGNSECKGGLHCGETSALAGSRAWTEEQDPYLAVEFKTGIGPRQQGPGMRNGTESQSVELEGL